jgi:kynurenine formamidase
MLLSLTACTKPPAEPAASNEVSLPKGARLVDLTHSFDEKTPYWPDKPPGSFTLTPIFCGKTPPGFFYCANKISAPEHGGTHLDAPLHFAEGHPSVDQIPLQQLIAPAVVVDLPSPAPDARLSAADLVAFEKKNGAIEPGSIVLVRTGWAERWPDRKSYYGSESAEDDSNLHFPGLAEDAAKLLVERKVAAVGIDSPGMDYGQSKDYIVHRTLLGANIPQMENLASLKELPPKGALVIALPIKIGKGSGGPLRAVAVLPPAKG